MSMLDIPDEKAPPAHPNVMIIFGAGGDLTARKLIPALFHLCHNHLLPESFAVLGLDRLDLNDESFREHLVTQVRDHLGAAFDPEVWERLAQRIHYMQGNIDDPRNVPASSASDSPASTPSAAPRAITSSIWRSRRACSATSPATSAPWG